MLNKKRLYKDKSNKKLEGVLAGIAEYFAADVSLVRILFVLLTIKIPTLCIFLYVIFAIVLPDKSDVVL